MGILAGVRPVSDATVKRFLGTGLSPRSAVSWFGLRSPIGGDPVKLPRL